MIINSLLDTDLYKLSMQKAVYHQFPHTMVEYEFKCRSGEDLSPYYSEIKDEIKNWCSLVFSESELQYLNSISYLKGDYVEYLKNYTPNFKYVEIHEKPFSIKVKGPWVETILYEVPILAIVNEVYFRNKISGKFCPADFYIKTKEQIDRVFRKILVANKNQIRFAEFGTRRRFSREWQEDVVKYLYQYINKDLFLGTSNVLLAKKYSIKPIGTQAHEWLQSGQVLAPTLRESQQFMLQKWAEEFRGSLGIALTDTIGIKAFLNDFDKYFANLYDGVRQDSGNPWEIGTKVINHYKSLGIDPKTKSIIFSDNLNMTRAISLKQSFGEDINVSFGIGTNLTNDIPDTTPMSIVMKLQRVNDKPVAKISDEPEKAQCQDAEYLKLVKKEFGIQ